MIPVEINATVLRMAEGLRIVTLCRDITERKQAEDALRARTQQLQTLIQAAPVAILALDDKGLVTLWNPGAERIFGWTAAEALGRPNPIIPPDKQAESQANLANITRGKFQYQMEVQRLRKDGSRVEVSLSTGLLQDAQGSGRGAIAILEDITERRRMNEILRENELRYRTLFEAAGDAIFIMNRERFEDCNAATLRMFGCARDEIIGVHPSVFSPEFQEDGTSSKVAADARIGAAFEQGSQWFEWLHCRKDLTPFPAEVTLTRIELGGETHLLAMVRDITERKRAEASLRREMNFSKTALDSLPGLFYLFTREGKFLRWNKNFEKVSGYSAAEILKMSPLDFFLDPEKKTIAEAIGKVFQTGEATAEGGFLSKDGTQTPYFFTGKHFSFDGQPCLTGMGIDISERKRAEEALRESETRIRTLTDNLSSGMIYQVVRRKDGTRKFTYLSDQVREFYGCTPQEAMENPDRIYGRVHPEDLQRVVEKEEEAHRDLSVLRIETRMLDPHGNIRWAYFVSTPRSLEDGVTCWDGIEFDITARVKAEAALRESEGRLRKILEQSPISMALVRMDGTIEYINRRAIETFGYLPEDIPTMERWWIQAYPDEAYRKEVVAQWMGLLEKAMAHNQEIERAEYRVTCKDGSVKTMVIFGVRVTGKVFVMFEDITERKRAEQTLLESEALLKESQRVAALGHYTYFIKEDRWVGSEALDAIFGIEGEAARNVQLWTRILHPEDREKMESYFRNHVLAKAQPFDMEYRISRVSDAAVRWVHGQGRLTLDASGHPSEMFGTIQDITGRKEVEQAMRESEVRYHALFDESADGILIADIETKMFTHANPAMCRMLGYSEAELCALGVRHIHPEAALPYVMAEFEAQVRGVKVLAENIPCLRKDGAVIYADINVARITIDGQLSSVGFFRDITERKRIETELAHHREHLEEMVSARTAELRTVNRELESFAYSVSHDLRAPLRSMDGFSRALLEEYDKKLDEQGRQYLQRVHEGAVRMGHLIDGLLLLSRTTRGEFEKIKVNLSQLAEEAAADLRESTPQPPIDFVVQPGLQIQGDPRLLRTLLQNLLGNSVKFSQGKKRPRIEFGVLDTQEAREKWSVTERVYFVRDNGAGFDMAYSGKLFGAFQRLHREDEFPGTGIGLATSQRVVHRHGGRIWAEGEVDKGATFYFTLS